MSSTREVRTVSDALETRAAEGEAPRLSGYAALYNSETVIGTGPFAFREVIAPGAFAEAVTRDDVRALFNHDPNHILGRTRAGTLLLAEDDRGLRYEVSLPDTTWARDLYASVQRGDISQSSFAFSVEAQQWKEPTARGELPVRTIEKVELFDVSPVTYPAYDATSVSARDQAAALAELGPWVDARAEIELARLRLEVAERA